MLTVEFYPSQSYSWPHTSYSTMVICLLYSEHWSHTGSVHTSFSHVFSGKSFLTFISLVPFQEDTTPTSRPTESLRDNHPQIFPTCSLIDRKVSPLLVITPSLSFYKYTFIFYSKTRNWTELNFHQRSINTIDWSSISLNVRRQGAMEILLPSPPQKCTCCPSVNLWNFTAGIVVDYLQVSTPVWL